MLSIDDKMLPPGLIANSGDEDLSGFKKSPTMKERKQKLNRELHHIEDLTEDMKAIALLHHNMQPMSSSNMTILKGY